MRSDPVNTTPVHGKPVYGKPVWMFSQHSKKKAMVQIRLPEPRELRSGLKFFPCHCFIPPRRSGLCSFVSAAINEGVLVLVLAASPSSSVWAASALLLSLYSSQTCPSRLKSLLKETVKLRLFTFLFRKEQRRKIGGVEGRSWKGLRSAAAA